MRRRHSDEPKAEYNFDYVKAMPNRFASKMAGGSLAVLLDPDVARVFRNAESVNTVLRALLTTMPSGRTRGARSVPATDR